MMVWGNWALWRLLLVCCCSFQCLVSGIENFLDEFSDLRCESRGMRFSLPSMPKEFASALMVLDSEGNSQDVRNDSRCGFWVEHDLDGSMTIAAAYDGCYVRREHEDYLMTLIVEQIKNGHVEHHKKDINCASLPVMDAPSPSDCAAIQRADRLQCANSSVPQDMCERLGCCFSPGDQPQCYYGKKLTAQCTDGQVLITLSKEITVPSLILDSASVLGVDPSSCLQMQTFKNSMFLMFQFPLSCGGASQVSGNNIVYENTVQATRDVRTWQGSSITRDSTMRVTVRCSYSQTGYVPLQVEVLTLPPPLLVSTTGPLKLEMRIAKDEVYASYYIDNEYPVIKYLKEPIFLEVRILQRTDPSLILMLDNCWATSTADPTQQVQWPVLLNGCPFPGDAFQTKQLQVGGPSQLVPYPTHYQRFAVSTFTFVDSQDQQPLGGLVYFHCSAVVCVPSATKSCSTSCGQRKRRDIKDDTEKMTVSKGPVSFIDHPVGSQDDTWEDDLRNETAGPDFVGAKKADPMDGGLIDVGKNFPSRVKDFDPDSSTMMWLRALAVGGGVFAVTVAVLGVWRCRKRRSPTMYSVKI
uniref:Zona pellucida sperm-binding protein 4 n=1 Tax=Engystomops pustulosus TaxID=76066 RepID=A0AAV6Z422_ENGPU|nr:hypothetical protein GDO81_027513 [Engystomops pustulosus]